MYQLFGKTNISICVVKDQIFLLVEDKIYHLLGMTRAAICKDQINHLFTTRFRMCIVHDQMYYLFGKTNFLVCSVANFVICVVRPSLSFVW